MYTGGRARVMEEPVEQSSLMMPKLPSTASKPRPRLWTLVPVASV